VRDVPDQIIEILRDSLTDRGIRQWWLGRNRYLDGQRPSDAWAAGEHRRVIGGALAFAEGVYL
jgi:hypothetical protein